MKRILGIAMMLGLLGAVTLIAGCSKEKATQAKEETPMEKVGSAPKEETPTEKVGSTPKEEAPTEKVGSTPKKETPTEKVGATPKKTDKVGEPAAKDVADFSDNIFTITLKRGLKKIELEMVLVPAGKFKMGFTKKELEGMKVAKLESLKRQDMQYQERLKELQKNEEPKKEERRKEESKKEDKVEEKKESRGKKVLPDVYKELPKEYREKEEEKRKEELIQLFKTFIGKNKLDLADWYIRYQGEQHEVTLTKPFYMGKYEVTQEQYEAVMGNNPSIKKGDKLPVTNVSWNDCQDFIKKLNAKTNGNYRLPSESEWEYACRAGKSTAYSFGDNITLKDANYGGTFQIGEPVVVGSYNANNFGLYDMHGNVCEWCEDWHGDYPAGTVIDPTGATTGKKRVVRGGSFITPAEDVHSSYRQIFTDPGVTFGNYGFRLAKDK